MSRFSCDIEFHYPKDKYRFDSLSEEFKLRSKNSSSNIDTCSLNSSYGENIKRNLLIVMDDASDLADTSQKFARFFTVARKFKYNCLNIFHTIHPEKSIWQSILSQTNILDIFPASIPLLSVTKMLQANCIHKTLRYIPINLLWINKLFIKLANKGENICLTIDCSGFNPNGLGRFRTKANNPDSQNFYFNVSNDDQIFNIFISTRINKEEGKIKFCFKLME